MNRVFRFTLVLVLLVIVGSASFVCYKVFFGIRTKVVPMVKNISVLEAMETLEQMAIPARIDQEESGLPQGMVVSQWPEAGMKLRENTPVILKVSRGTTRRPLPDLRGQMATQASSTLESQGFVVGDILRVHSERPAGVVIAQSPAAPESIPTSHSVDLLVSLGPSVANGLVVVPDLRDQNIQVARELIAESNLRARVVRTYTQASPEGMVIAMTPAAGTQVARNTEVTLRVASWDPRYADRTSSSGARVVVVDSKENQAPAQTSDQSQAAPEVPSEALPPVGISAPVPASSPAPAEAPASSEPVLPPGISAPVPATRPIPEPEPAPSSAPVPIPASDGRTKRAVVRYQVPPMSAGLRLRIEIVDSVGTRVLIDRAVTDGEYINLTESYADEAVVTIHLGEQFVWQDRFR